MKTVNEELIPEKQAGCKAGPFHHTIMHRIWEHYIIPKNAFG